MSSSRVEIGREAVYWQPAPSGVTASTPTALLLHGMCHGAYDFWPCSDQMTDGVGLPEEANLVRALRTRGYRVVAMSSADRDRKAWNTLRDAPRIEAAVTSEETCN